MSTLHFGADYNEALGLQHPTLFEVVRTNLARMYNRGITRQTVDFPVFEIDELAGRAMNETMFGKNLVMPDWLLDIADDNQRDLVLLVINAANKAIPALKLDEHLRKEGNVEYGIKPATNSFSVTLNLPVLEKVSMHFVRTSG